MKITNTDTLPPEPDDLDMDSQPAPAQPEPESEPESEPELAVETVVLEGSHPALNLIRWVALARSKDKDQEQLQRIEVQEKDGVIEAIATDGRRLHAARVSGLEPGAYKVVKALKTRVELEPIPDPDPYPTWRQVVPDPDASDREYVSVSHVSDKDTSPLGLAVALGVPYNAASLWDALDFGTPGYCSSLVLNRSKVGAIPDSLLVLHGDGARAVVMPMRPPALVVLKSKPKGLVI